MDVLKYLNVAPSQIQPNSQAFIRGFEVLCDALDLEPSIGVFFHFYGTKGVDKLSWVSISAHPGKKLFPPYASNFKKDWRETFVWVQGAKGCTDAVVKVDEDLMFPLCWMSTPVAVMGYDFDKMTPYEQGMVGFFGDIFSIFFISQHIIIHMDKPFGAYKLRTMKRQSI